ncbi:MAG: hypothetical protein ACFFCV_21715 [Promethearchaeota archaeon]
MLDKKKKRKLLLKLLLSIFASGIVLSLFFILPHYLDVSNYRSTNDLIIEHNEGFSGVNIDFRMSHRIGNSFDTLLIYQTISSADIEEIGITDITYDIYRDEDLIWIDDLDFSEPMMYVDRSLILQNIGLYNNITCIGTIKAQFNVEGTSQEETFDFVLSIFMPVNPHEIRSTYLLNSIWIYTGLGFGLLVLIGLIYRTTNEWRREIKYSDEEIKKDRDYFDYISYKVKENKKKST